jgi:hypothetical protein
MDDISTAKTLIITAKSTKVTTEPANQEKTDTPIDNALTQISSE